MVAIVYADDRLSCAPGGQRLSDVHAASASLFFENIRRPVMLPAMTPTPATPKPTYVSVLVCLAGSGGGTLEGVTGGARLRTTSFVSCSATSTSCLAVRVPSCATTTWWPGLRRYGAFRLAALSFTSSTLAVASGAPPARRSIRSAGMRTSEIPRRAPRRPSVPAESRPARRAPSVP